MSFHSSQFLTNGKTGHGELPVLSLPCDWLIGVSRALDCSIWEPGIAMGRQDGLGSLGIARGSFAAPTAAGPTALLELSNTGGTRVHCHSICGFPEDLSQRINIVSTVVQWIKRTKTQSAGALRAAPGFMQGSLTAAPLCSPARCCSECKHSMIISRAAAGPRAGIGWRGPSIVRGDEVQKVI